MQGSGAMRLSICAAILAALVPTVAEAAGMASGNNFSVLTPATPSQQAGDAYAQLVVDRAEAFRAEFARQWLGEELPTGEGRTLISIDFSSNRNSGLTLAKDHPARQFHRVFLASTAENAAGSLLRHEIVHTVLATRYPHPNRLPTWVEEGIASRYDSRRLIAIRQQEVRNWVSAGRVPSLASLFDESKISSCDDTAYATAESLVAYLLTRGDKRTLLQFAADGQHCGWDESLRTKYQIAGVARLQRDWQAWIAQSARRL
jgi:hypothetical protein